MNQPPQVPPPPGGWPPPPGWSRGPDQSPTFPQPAASPPVQPSPTLPPAGGPGMSLPPGWTPTVPDAHPGVVPLRQLAVGELLTGTFATVRLQWRPLLAVAAAVAAVATLLAIPVLVMARDLINDLVRVATLDSGAPLATTNAAVQQLADSAVEFLPWLALVAVGQAVAAVVIDAGAALVVGEAVLGRSVTAATVLRQLISVLPRLLLMALIAAVGIGVGLMLCVLPGLALVLLWFAAPSVLMLEGGSVPRALQRSWTLVRRSFWRTAGVLLVVYLVYTMAMQVVIFPISAVSSIGWLDWQVGGGPDQAAVTALLFGYLAMIVVSVFGYPLLAVARAMVYLDLRMRHENLAAQLTDAGVGSRG